MDPVSSLAPPVIAELVRRQPFTPAKLAFCWRLVVGPAVDRATRVHLSDKGDVVVEVTDAHWKRELDRMASEITGRLKSILGDDLKRVVVRKRAR